MAIPAISAAAKPGAVNDSAGEDDDDDDLGEAVVEVEEEAAPEPVAAPVHVVDAEPVPADDSAVAALFVDEQAPAPVA